MQPIHIYKVAKSIACHCWNKDRTQIALAVRSSNQILIYGNCSSSSFEDWKLLHTLRGHDLPITALDWDPVYNRILSCSEDCNAYVWNYENGSWIPTLVVLKIKRAALCCKWSPDGRTFAVGSSEKKLRICTFNVDQNLWVHPSGVHIKEKGEEVEASGNDALSMSTKTRGSILCVAWDRTGQLLCRGSLDGSMVIISTYYDPSQPIQKCPFSIEDKDVFGFVFGDKCGVVEDIAFNLSNTCIAYTGGFIQGSFILDRNSDVTFLEFEGLKMSKQILHCPTLPFTKIIFITDSVVAAGGFDNNLHILAKKNGSWEYVGIADTASQSSSSLSSSFQSRMRMLQSNSNFNGMTNGNMSNSGNSSQGPHTNAITNIQVKTSTETMCKEISTSGLDGKVIVWDMEMILKKMNLL